jgi:hypothetical protein
MKSLLTVLLVLVPLYAFAQDAKMPAEAKKIIDKYDAAVEVAKKAYDATVAKARDQALKDLKPIQTSETKKGNLDGAILVKNKIDELLVSSSLDNLNPVKEPAVVANNRVFSNFVIGTWVGEGGVKGGPDWSFSITEKEIHLVEEGKPNHSVKYRFISEDSINFDWSNANAVMEVTREGNSLKLVCRRSNGSIVWTQILNRK